MATYYFSSSTGNDSTGLGTLASPWANFRGKKDGAAALSAGDICYFKGGDTWSGDNAQLYCDSSGSSGSPIIFDRYGTGADPVFNHATAVTGWTLHSGSIYKKAGLSTTINCVGVDGVYALGIWSGSNTTLSAGEFRNESGTLYIRLSDSSNPSGHTIYVPNNQVFSSGFGVISTGVNSGRGNYVQFNHLKLLFPNGMGFTSTRPDVVFNDCSCIGAGRDAFSFRKDGTTNTSDRAQANRCVATFANCNSVGQAFTSESPDTVWKNCVAALTFKAGFDFQDYYTVQDVNQCAAIYCVAYKTGQWDSSVSYDPPFYVDGAHNILIYGCIGHGAGIGVQSARAVSPLAIGNENQSIKTVSNIKVVNSLFYDGSYFAAHLGNTGTQLLDGIEFINCTFIKSGGFGGCGVLYLKDLKQSSSLKIKNCIIMATSSVTSLLHAHGSPTGLLDSDVGTNGAYIDSDYNVFYNATGSSIVNYNTVDKTLAQWQAAPYTKDLNSLSSNPQILNSNPASWVTSTQYQLGSYITNSGTVYLCLATHTSGTFATDLASYYWTALSTYFDVRLKRTALGESATSPAIDAGLESPWTPPAWVTTNALLADNGAVVGTTRSDGISDDVSTFMDIGFHYYTPTPNGNLTSTNIQPATLYLGTTNTVTITFTTANSIPSDGKIVITFPTSLGGGFGFDSGGTTAASFNSGGSGSLTVSRLSNVVTMTRSGGSSIAASQAVSIDITFISNPSSTGSTGAYQIKTTTSADATIDIDSNVSADQIITPPVGFSTITITGVNMSGVTIFH